MHILSGPRRSIFTPISRSNTRERCQFTQNQACREEPYREIARLMGNKSTQKNSDHLKKTMTNKRAEQDSIKLPKDRNRYRCNLEEGGGPSRVMDEGVSNLKVLTRRSPRILLTKGAKPHQCNALREGESPAGFRPSVAIHIIN